MSNRLLSREILASHLVTAYNLLLNVLYHQEQASHGGCIEISVLHLRGPVPTWKNWLH